MPKVKRNANMSRMARRRTLLSDSLPSPVTRKVGAENTCETQTKIFDSKSNSLEKEAELLQKRGEVIQKKNPNAILTIDSNDFCTKSQPKQQLSRGQRKRQAKRDQFLRKEKMILSSLMLQRKEQQKKRIDGLDAIKQALMDTTEKNTENVATKSTVQYVSTNKAKRKLVAKEVEHINLILQHPAFKKDPFATMQEHLRNTFVDERKQQELLSKRRTEDEKQKVETKRLEKNGIKKKTQKRKYKPRRTR